MRETNKERGWRQGNKEENKSKVISTHIPSKYSKAFWYVEKSFSFGLFFVLFFLSLKTLPVKRHKPALQKNELCPKVFEFMMD